MAICHFFFWTYATSGTVNLAAAQTGTYDWGSTTYLNTAQWGTAGSGIIGNSMNTSSGGTAITSATQGFELTPVAASTTATIVAGTKTMKWYQPKWASTYTSTALRRYGGGYNNSTADQVKGYCVSQRMATATTTISSGIAVQTAVTLSSATALAAGAIAFGAAALAI